MIDWSKAKPPKGLFVKIPNDIEWSFGNLDVVDGLIDEYLRLVKVDEYKKLVLDLHKRYRGVREVLLESLK